MKEKRKLFEYILFRLITWFSTEKGIPSPQKFNSNNDLSMLKVLKLLFFVSSLKTELLKRFNFYALPYGHVETDIYDLLKAEGLEFFSIGNQITTINTPYKSFTEIELEFNSSDFRELKCIVDTAFESIIEINRKLVLFSATELVELSHNWESWQMMYSLAQRHNKSSQRIPNNLIASESKIFHLV